MLKINHASAGNTKKYWVDDSEQVVHIWPATGNDSSKMVEVVVADWYPGTHAEWQESIESAVKNDLIDRGILTRDDCGESINWRKFRGVQS